MRRRLLTVLLLLGMPLLAAAACARPWRVPYEDWRPYSFIDAAGEHAGLETELLAAIAREMDCSISYVPLLPRNRRMPMLVAGQLDLLIAASHDEAALAAGTVWFTRPYRLEEFGAFALADAGSPAEAQSMAGLLEAGTTLLAHRGPDILPIFEQFAARGLLTRFEDYAKGLQLLRLGRGEVLIGDRLAVLYAAQAEGAELKELAVPVLRDEVAYKLSRRRFSAAELSRFNAAIQRLEAQGELQRIRARWLPAAMR